MEICLEIKDSGQHFILKSDNTGHLPLPAAEMVLSFAGLYFKMAFRSDSKDKQYPNPIRMTLNDLEAIAQSRNLKSRKKKKQKKEKSLTCKFQEKQEHHHTEDQERVEPRISQSLWQG